MTAASKLIGSLASAFGPEVIELTVKYVRTPEGAEYFGQPIGTPIAPGLHAFKAKQHGYNPPEGSFGDAPPKMGKPSTKTLKFGTPAATFEVPAKAVVYRPKPTPKLKPADDYWRLAVLPDGTYRTYSTKPTAHSQDLVGHKKTLAFKYISSGQYVEDPSWKAAKVTVQPKSEHLSVVSESGPSAPTPAAAKAAAKVSDLGPKLSLGAQKVKIGDLVSKDGTTWYKITGLSQTNADVQVHGTITWRKLNSATLWYVKHSPFDHSTGVSTHDISAWEDQAVGTGIQGWKPGTENATPKIVAPAAKAAALGVKKNLAAQKVKAGDLISSDGQTWHLVTEVTAFAAHVQIAGKTKWRKLDSATLYNVLHQPDTISSKADAEAWQNTQIASVDGTMGWLPPTEAPGKAAAASSVSKSMVEVGKSAGKVAQAMSKLAELGNAAAASKAATVTPAGLSLKEVPWTPVSDDVLPFAISKALHSKTFGASGVVRVQLPGQATSAAGWYVVAGPKHNVYQLSDGKLVNKHIPVSMLGASLAALKAKTPGTLVQDVTPGEPKTAAKVEAAPVPGVPAEHISTGTPAVPTAGDGNWLLGGLNVALPAGTSAYMSEDNNIWASTPDGSWFRLDEDTGALHYDATGGVLYAAGKMDGASGLTAAPEWGDGPVNVMFSIGTHWYTAPSGSKVYKFGADKRYVHLPAGAWLRYSELEPAGVPVDKPAGALKDFLQPVGVLGIPVSDELTTKLLAEANNAFYAAKSSNGGKLDITKELSAGDSAVVNVDGDKWLYTLLSTGDVHRISPDGVATTMPLYTAQALLDTLYGKANSYDEFSWVPWKLDGPDPSKVKPAPAPDGSVTEVTAGAIKVGTGVLNIAPGDKLYHTLVNNTGTVGANAQYVALHPDGSLNFASVESGSTGTLPGPAAATKVKTLLEQGKIEPVDPATMPHLSNAPVPVGHVPTAVNVQMPNAMALPPGTKVYNYEKGGKWIRYVLYPGGTIRAISQDGKSDWTVAPGNTSYASMQHLMQGMIEDGTAQPFDVMGKNTGVELHPPYENHGTHIPPGEYQILGATYYMDKAFDAFTQDGSVLLRDEGGNWSVVDPQVHYLVPMSDKAAAIYNNFDNDGKLHWVSKDDLHWADPGSAPEIQLDEPTSGSISIATNEVQTTKSVPLTPEIGTSYLSAGSKVFVSKGDHSVWVQGPTGQWSTFNKDSGWEGASQPAPDLSPLPVDTIIEPITPSTVNSHIVSTPGKYQLGDGTVVQLPKGVKVYAFNSGHLLDFPAHGKIPASLLYLGSGGKQIGTSWTEDDLQGMLTDGFAHNFALPEPEPSDDGVIKATGEYTVNGTKITLQKGEQLWEHKIGAVYLKTHGDWYERAADNKGWVPTSYNVDKGIATGTVTPYDLSPAGDALPKAGKYFFHNSLYTLPEGVNVYRRIDPATGNTIGYGLYYQSSHGVWYYTDGNSAPTLLPVKPKGTLAPITSLVPAATKSNTVSHAGTYVIGGTPVSLSVGDKVYVGKGLVYSQDSSGIWKVHYSEKSAAVVASDKIKDMKNSGIIAPWSFGVPPVAPPVESDGAYVIAGHTLQLPKGAKLYTFPSAAYYYFWQKTDGSWVRQYKDSPPEPAHMSDAEMTSLVAVDTSKLSTLVDSVASGSNVVPTAGIPDFHYQGHTFGLPGNAKLYTSVLGTLYVKYSDGSWNALSSDGDLTSQPTQELNQKVAQGALKPYLIPEVPAVDNVVPKGGIPDFHYQGGTFSVPSGAKLYTAPNGTLYIKYPFTGNPWVKVVGGKKSAAISPGGVTEILSAVASGEYKPYPIPEVPAVDNVVSEHAVVHFGKAAIAVYAGDKLYVTTPSGAYLYIKRAHSGVWDAYTKDGGSVVTETDDKIDGYLATGQLAPYAYADATGKIMAAGPYKFGDGTVVKLPTGSVVYQMPNGDYGWTDSNGTLWHAKDGAAQQMENQTLPHGSKLYTPTQLDEPATTLPHMGEGNYLLAGKNITLTKGSSVYTDSDGAVYVWDGSGVWYRINSDSGDLEVVAPLTKEAMDGSLTPYPALALHKITSADNIVTGGTYLFNGTKVPIPAGSMTFIGGHALYWLEPDGTWKKYLPSTSPQTITDVNELTGINPYYVGAPVPEPKINDLKANTAYAVGASRIIAGGNSTLWRSADGSYVLINNSTGEYRIASLTDDGSSQVLSQGNVSELNMADYTPVVPVSADDLSAQASVFISKGLAKPITAKEMSLAQPGSVLVLVTASDGGGQVNRVFLINSTTIMKELKYPGPSEISKASAVDQLGVILPPSSQTVLASFASGVAPHDGSWMINGAMIDFAKDDKAWDFATGKVYIKAADGTSWYVDPDGSHYKLSDDTAKYIDQVLDSEPQAITPHDFGTGVAETQAPDGVEQVSVTLAGQDHKLNLPAATSAYQTIGVNSRVILVSGGKVTGVYWDTGGQLYYSDLNGATSAMQSVYDHGNYTTVYDFGQVQLAKLGMISGHYKLPKKQTLDLYPDGRMVLTGADGTTSSVTTAQVLANKSKAIYDGPVPLDLPSGTGVAASVPVVDLKSTESIDKMFKAGTQYLHFVNQGDGTWMMKSTYNDSTWPVSTEEVLNTFKKSGITDSYGTSTALVKGSKKVFLGGNQFTLPDVQDALAANPDPGSISDFQLLKEAAGGSYMSSYVLNAVQKSATERGTNVRGLLESFVGKPAPSAAALFQIKAQAQAAAESYTPSTITKGATQINPMVVTVDAFTGASSSSVNAAIKNALDATGYSGVAGKYMTQMSVEYRQAWLKAWYTGNWGDAYDLEVRAAQISGVKVPHTFYVKHPGSPIYPGASADHTVNFAPADPNQVKAGLPVHGTGLPANYTPNTIKADASLGEAYMFAAGLNTYAQGMSQSQRAQIVAAHLDGDQIKVDWLTLAAKHNVEAGHLLSSPMVPPKELVPPGTPVTDLPTDFPQMYPQVNFADHLTQAQTQEYLASIFPTGQAQALLQNNNLEALQGLVQLHFLAGIKPQADAYLQPDEAKAKFTAFADQIASDYADGALSTHAAEGWGVLAALGSQKLVLHKLPASEQPDWLQTGTATKYMVADQKGQKYIFKVAKEKFRPYTEDAAHKAAQLFGFNMAGSTVTTVSGTSDFGQAQTLLNKVGDLKGFIPAELTKRELSDIARINVLDWVLDDDDSHWENFIRTPDGGIAPVDKGRAWVRFGQYKLKRGQLSANVLSDSIKVYDPIYNAIVAHKIDQKSVDAMYRAAIYRARFIAHQPDDRYREILDEAFQYRTDFSKTSAPNAAALIEQAVARKNSVEADFEKFWDSIYKDAGWDKPTLAAELAPGVHGGLGPETLEDVQRSGYAGHPGFFAGQDFEESMLMLRDVIDTKGDHVYVGFGMVRKDADAKLNSFLKNLSTSEVTTQDSPAVPVGLAQLSPSGHFDWSEQALYDKILLATKTINYHQADGEYPQAKIDGLNAAIADMHAALNEWEANKDTFIKDNFGGKKNLAGQYHDMLLSYQASALQAKAAYDGKAKVGAHFDRWTYVEVKDADPALPEVAKPKSAPPPFTVTWGPALFYKGKQEGKYEKLTGATSDVKDKSGQPMVRGKAFHITFADGTTVEYRPWNGAGQPTAHQGYLRFQTGALDDLQIAQVMQLLQQAGVNVDGMDSQEQMELYYWRHLYGIAAAGRMDTTETKMVQQEFAKLKPDSAPDDATRLELWRKVWSVMHGKAKVDKFVAEQGYMPHFQHFQTDPEQGPGHGKPHWIRFDADIAELRKHNKPLGHSLSGGMDSILASGTLLGTEERHKTLGSTLAGMSSGEDQTRGSSDNIYTTQNSTYGEIFIDPSVLAWTSTYALPGDYFGSISQKKSKSPWDPSELGHGSSNETMLRGQISLIDLARLIVCSNKEQRDEELKRLHDAGITKILGHPIEDVFVTPQMRDEAMKRVLKEMKDGH